MYRIGALAQASGVSRDTLRFYERAGLLRPEGRSEGGYRLYDEEAFQRLRFIKQAQALGLSLEEIRAVLEVMHEGQPPCADVRQILRQKVALLEERIAELTALRDDLVSRLEWAEAHPDPACDGKDHCVYLDPASVQH
ncbi:heavy metal-responsive transcriptional regulator [Meiothermus sp.]|uniref:heavy metal-responsive transcriptional regulator n=1 Tax=Meiothermus sp. TaxID=1955249 RepID=UPI00307EA95F